MDETRMQPCSKCLQPAGNDAVLLKNGCYMCPACYQRAYPVKAMSSGPKRVVVSVEGVLAILLTVGGMYGANALYQHHVKTTEAEAIAQKQAEELAEKRQREDRAAQEAAQEAARKKQEADRLAADTKRDADRKAQQEAVKVAAELRKKELEFKQQQIEQQRLDEQAKRDSELRAEAAAKERKELLDKAKDSADEAKKRNADIAEQLGITAEMEKVLARANGELSNKQRTYTAHKNIFDTKKSALEAMAKKYNYHDLNRFKLLGENSLQYSGCVNHGFADTSEA